ncbi:hypothetical protein GCM10027289_29890 [Tsukamurella serpentis]
MFTKKFWRDATERAIKTAAQSAIGVFAADVTVLSLNWPAAGAVVGTATLLSYLTSIVSSGVGDRESASALPDTYGRHAA